MVLKEDPKRVESLTRLSQSKLWEIQQNYFRSMGIEAWKEEVPSYVSSNNFIGYQYARLVLNCIKDWLHLHPEYTDETFYIQELGCGTGKFSFHFISALKELMALYGLANHKVCFIITDLIQDNVDACKNNVKFAPFIEKKEVDFACVSVFDKDCLLQIQNKLRSEVIGTNLFIIIANYTFDCIRHDVFLYQEKILKEMKLAIRSRFPNFDVKKSLHLKELKLEYQFDSLEETGKNDLDPILLEFLKEYTGTFQDQNVYIPFPVGAFEYFQYLQSDFAQPCFIIMGDKGITSKESLSLLSLPNLLSFDGCYSFTVNFDALALFCKKLGGDALLSENNNDFKVNVFCTKSTFSEFPTVQHYFKTGLDQSGPNDYSALYEVFMSNSYRFSLSALLSFLRWSEYDPQAYAVMHDRVIELLPSANPFLKMDWIKAVTKVEKNIYPIPFGEDVHNLLGIFYQHCGMLEKALEVYHSSMSFFPQDIASFFNVASIYESEKKVKEAIHFYEKAVAVDKHNRIARVKLKRLKKEFSIESLFPVLKLLFVGVLILFVLFLFQ